MQLSEDQLIEIVKCPNCDYEIRLGQESSCPRCGAVAKRLEYAWELTPPSNRTDEEIWQTWEKIQANGVITYEADPENNLNVGDRPDSLAFARFCAYDGLVLDVGCGPQPWPAHFSGHTDRTRFVGIDPLVGEKPAEFTQIRGLAEYLPFRDGVFDQVIFATTIDHFVDPVRALREAARVGTPECSIALWIGEKSEDAPPPERSYEWYEKLEKPPGADDVFHIKRLGVPETEDLLERADLDIVEHVVLPIDEWRANHFYRAVPSTR